jgi:hypothetical protein
MDAQYMNSNLNKDFAKVTPFLFLIADEDINAMANDLVCADIFSGYNVG